MSMKENVRCQIEVLKSQMRNHARSLDSAVESAALKLINTEPPYYGLGESLRGFVDRMIDAETRICSIGDQIYFLEFILGIESENDTDQ